MRRVLVPLLALSIWLGRASAQPLAEPGVHVVAAGQRLESIARRYSVSVDAICTASGVSRDAVLRVGQRLVIPARSDPDGTTARSAREKGQVQGLDRDGRGSEASGNARAGESPRRSEPSQSPAATTAAQAIHRVTKGQTLGGIALRYRVTVLALRAANGLSQRSTLKIGQKLLIPVPSSDSQRAKVGEPSPGRAPRREATKSGSAPKVHEVARGHTLGKLAKRYGVSIEAICEANEIDRKRPLKLGQKLVIPGPGEDGDGAAARRLRARLDASPEGGELRGTVRPRPARETTRRLVRSWRDYAKRPAKRGKVTLIGWNERWTGYVVDKRGRILPNAREQISRVMAATGKRPRADVRLVQLIAKVSDTFGGRPIRVVSGYRKESYFQDSRHRTSQALDFSIPGIPNEAIRDYLRTLQRVGVGYYPNSSFVHMDTRAVTTYWVDYSGPGEAPRSRQRLAAAPSSGNLGAGDPGTQDGSARGAEEPGEPSEPEQARPESGSARTHTERGQVSRAEGTEGTESAEGGRRPRARTRQPRENAAHGTERTTNGRSEAGSGDDASARGTVSTPDDREDGPAEEPTTPARKPRPRGATAAPEHSDG